MPLLNAALCFFPADHWRPQVPATAAGCQCTGWACCISVSCPCLWICSLPERQRMHPSCDRRTAASRAHICQFLLAPLLRACLLALHLTTLCLQPLAALRASASIPAQQILAPTQTLNCPAPTKWPSSPPPPPPTPLRPVHPGHGAVDVRHADCCGHAHALRPAG